MTMAAIFYSGIEIIVSRIIIQQSFEKMSEPPYNKNS